MLEAEGVHEGELLVALLDSAQLVLRWRQETRVHDIDEVTCAVHPPSLPRALVLSVLVGSLPVAWFAVADEFGTPSVVASVVLLGCVALAARAISRLEWTVMFMSRTEFATVGCGWRSIKSFKDMSTRLEGTRLSRAWRGVSLVGLPRLAWTELRLASRPSDELFDELREREQSPLPRRDYRIWRLRRAQAMSVFGLAIPFGLALSGAVASGSARGAIGALALWAFVLLPGGTAVASRVHAELLRRDGVAQRAPLQPMFRR